VWVTTSIKSLCAVTQADNSHAINTNACILALINSHSFYVTQIKSLCAVTNLLKCTIVNVIHWMTWVLKVISASASIFFVQCHFQPIILQSVWSATGIYNVICLSVLLWHWALWPNDISNSKRVRRTEQECP